MKLRDYQEHAVQSIFDYFEEGKTGNPVLVFINIKIKES